MKKISKKFRKDKWLAALIILFVIIASHNVYPQKLSQSFEIE